MSRNKAQILKEVETLFSVHMDRLNGLLPEVAELPLKDRGEVTSAIITRFFTYGACMSTVDDNVVKVIVDAAYSLCKQASKLDS